MHAKLSDWQNGWFGVSLELTVEEIDRLIEMLKLIRDDSEQHFHLTSDYQAAGGVGDIEICQMTQPLVHNLRITGKAMGLGDTVAIDPLT